MADLKIGRPVAGVASLNQPLAESCKASASQPGDDSNSECSSGASSAIALGIVAANCGAAIYHSWHDPWSVAFVVASFLILVLLFLALRVYESSPRGSRRSLHVKAGVWALSTALTIMFSYKVAAFMPFPVAAVVWVTAGSTIFVGFYMLFFCRDEVEPAVEEKPAKVSDMA